MTAVQPALDGSEPEPAQSAARRRSADYETWVDEITPTFEDVCRTNRRWTSFEIAEEFNLPDPPNPRAHWGRFVQHLAEKGLSEHVGYDETARPEGGHSAVKVWRGTRAARQGRAA